MGDEQREFLHISHVTHALKILHTEFEFHFERLEKIERKKEKESYSIFVPLLASLRRKESFGEKKMTFLEILAP